MAELIERDGQGNWNVRGLPWAQMQAGKTVTYGIWEKLYGCLFKLMQYERTGLTPEQVEKLQETHSCVPEDMLWRRSFGIKIAQCKCGVIVTGDQNYCNKCGARLLWRRKEVGAVGTERGEE